MIDEAVVTKQINPEMEEAAVQKAKIRARAARWDLDVAVFLFAILIIIIILLFQEVVIEVVASVAILGLAVVWLTGWRRGKQLYQRFYDEELLKLEQGSPESIEEAVKEVKETIEDVVKKALRERWQNE